MSDNHTRLLLILYCTEVNFLNESSHKVYYALNVPDTKTDFNTNLFVV